MKKNLGLLIALIGIIAIGCALTFTPNYSFNPGDSNSGTDASSPLFFGSLIVFGAGVVIYAEAVSKKKA
ncbi:hypothetical protein [Mucilaginibacter segetis]|uniref:Uncharacterized protein n=1 Tax=Mucilaginibacter segetis TaxID=2793071 RepID=A0A934PX70_9SPHI|nr:hypothetical protein [Mucilaginibacter segetis]MBK0381152.1 hypothetical protein [Mucilaginibacter segetis]